MGGCSGWEVERGAASGTRRGLSPKVLSSKLISSLHCVDLRNHSLITAQRVAGVQARQRGMTIVAMHDATGEIESRTIVYVLAGRACSKAIRLKCLQGNHFSIAQRDGCFLGAVARTAGAPCTNHTYALAEARAKVPHACECACYKARSAWSAPWHSCKVGHPQQRTVPLEGH